jgi:hypothetical protein
MHEKIKILLYSGNVFYHSDRNIVSSHLLSKNMNCKIHDTLSSHFQWVCHLIFNIERRTQAAGVQEQRAEEDIWAKERGSKLLNKGFS